MATVTPGYTFTNDEVVTPAKLNSAATPVVSNIVTDDLVDANVTTAKIANGAVTQEKLNSSVTLVPTGAIMPFAMNSAPSGWLAANGTAVSRTTYAALFAAIGTTYGAGTGGTTFNLPDLRGYFVRGAGTNTDATASGTFGAKQGNTVGPHTHTGTTDNDSPDHTHTTYTGRRDNTDIWDGSYPAGNSNPIAQTASPWQTSGASAKHKHPFTTSSQSPASTTETRPNNIAMLYCIKA
jgi:microcystin-dependent protein